MDKVFQNCAQVSGLNSLKDFQRDCIENFICGNDVFGAVQQLYNAQGVGRWVRFTVICVIRGGGVGVHKRYIIIIFNIICRKYIIYNTYPIHTYCPRSAE